ncbi:patatin-like phospholipase family protein [Oceanispirochaeta sp.]|jgi:NTE family protein|uniref:patatin-like phospholipase family protein n=1 Tax=Oceanispirochaeta sp. TaxID=2035350 RepID=UPI0026374B77|nr:patatin-like phospholipase family protein [Oceanispirochaeta sp.]MDA3955201.1 patatin-like phospholipase family protein [Oceanispirochaeta sp.]
MRKKRFLLPLLILLLGQIQAQENSVEKTEKPVVALVLAGGGALGFAHVGVLQVLKEEGIRPDMVIGTSIGSIIGGLYCCGYSPDELETIIIEADWKNLILDKFDRKEISFEQKSRERRYYLSIGLNKEGQVENTGFSQGQHAVEFLDRLMAQYASEMDFDDLPIPFRAVAADFITGEKIVYATGDLKTAIRASMSIPGIFTPVYYQGRYAIDGGWVENLPTTVAKDMGADIIIAVSLYSLEQDIEKLSNIAAIAAQADQIKTHDKDKISLKAVDLLISPNLKGYNMGDFAKGAPLITLGYEAADNMRSEIKNLASEISDSSAPKEKKLITGYPMNKIVSETVLYPLRKIIVDSKGRPDLELKLAATLKEALSNSPDITQIQKHVYALFDSGEYKRLRYRLIAVEDGQFDLLVEAPPVGKPDELISAAVNFSILRSESIMSDFSLKLAYQYWFGRNKTGYYDVEAWLSAYPSFMLSLGYDPSNWSGMLILRTGVLQNPAYFYDSDHLESSYLVGKTGASLYYEQPFLRRLEITTGSFARLNWMDFKEGEKNFSEINSFQYGVKAFFAADTLDRVIAPRKGVNFLVFSELQLTPEEEESAILLKGAGEVFIPLWSGAQMIPFGEYQNVVNGNLSAVSRPFLGEGFSVAGYMPQELRAENIIMGGLTFQQKILDLPYSVGNEFYLQLKTNTASLWVDSEVDEHRDSTLYQGGSIGVMVATYLGELEMNVQFNKDMRWTLFLGLSTSSVLFKDRYF